MKCHFHNKHRRFLSIIHHLFHTNALKLEKRQADVFQVKGEPSRLFVPFLGQFRARIINGTFTHTQNSPAKL